MLGRRRADGSSLIRVEELRDGIVAFEDEADAHRYASMLEADGSEVRHSGKALMCFFPTRHTSLVTARVMCVEAAFHLVLLPLC